MRALDRKVVRDLMAMKGQALAIALVMGCGVATFVMSLSLLQSLSLTQEAYYERYRFAQVFARLKRAPESLATRIAEIPGVARVQTRTVVDVTLDVAGLTEPAAGRLIAIPERPTPGLNDVYLRAGRYIEPGRGTEVLVSEGFAAANKLTSGSQVLAVINGKRQALKVVGVALSPEYVYQIRPGEVLPDDRRFGVFWMGRDELAAAFDMKGAFNDVTLVLMPGASEPEIVRRLDRLIEPYGGLGAHGRSDQVSHRFISNEIRELRSMGMVAPIIFLSVAAFLLNIVLNRLIGTQREQIAALKAFGYSHLEVGLHYLKLVLLIDLVGVVIGAIAGGMMGRSLTVVYVRFFHFPVLRYHLDLWVIALAFLVSICAAVVGTLGAVRKAVRLPPAEAMRPEPPATYRPSLIERLAPGALVSPATRMILRHLGRQPLKAFFSILGIAMGTAVLVVGSFMEDAVNYLMDFQFNGAQRQDLTVAFVEPSSQRAINEVRHLKGVMSCEPFRSVPARLRFGPRSHRVGIMGLEPTTRLFRVLDVAWRDVPRPVTGLVLSEKLGELLDVRAGDMVTIEVLEGERPVRQERVERLIKDYEGTSAYMNIHAIRHLMHEGPTASGAFLRVDGAWANALYTRLKNTPRVSSVAVKKAALESFRDTVAENLMRMRAFNVAFAAVIAFGVVYNSARISLSERSRDLATLRVIGFTRGEISLILLGELAVLTVAALPLGMMLGYVLAWTASLANNTEMFRIPFVVNRSTFAMAGLVTILAALASGMIVRRRLDQLDLVGVLKTRE